MCFKSFFFPLSLSFCLSPHPLFFSFLSIALKCATTRILRRAHHSVRQYFCEVRFLNGLDIQRTDTDVFYTGDHGEGVTVCPAWRDSLCKYLFVWIDIFHTIKKQTTNNHSVFAGLFWFEKVRASEFWGKVLTFLGKVVRFFVFYLINCA